MAFTTTSCSQAMLIDCFVSDLHLAGKVLTTLTSIRAHLGIGLVEEGRVACIAG